MNWTKIAWVLAHGTVSGLIALGTALVVLPEWPTAHQWLVIAGGTILAFAKDVYAYLKEPVP